MGPALVLDVGKGLKGLHFICGHSEHIFQLYEYRYYRMMSQV